MKSFNLVKSAVLFSIIITLAIFTSNCITEKNQQSGVQQNITSVPAPATPIEAIEKNLSINQASEVIQAFVMPQKIENLTYVKAINKTKTTLYEFRSDTASFFINLITGRVQSATWMGSGPVISSIKSDINQSCKLVEEFAKERYPDIWVSNDTRDMSVESAGILPLGIDTKYECAWFETLYYPDKKTSPHFTIRVRNSVTIVIDPTTGMIQSYEETYIPLEPSLNLRPTISEYQAWEFAKQYFEENGVTTIQLSEQTNYGLFISTTENGRQYLIYALKVEQNRNHTTSGGLVGIDAHDGHVVYHATF